MPFFCNVKGLSNKQKNFLCHKHFKNRDVYKYYTTKLQTFRGEKEDAEDRKGSDPLLLK